jgi:hypothetical protein
MMWKSALAIGLISSTALFGQSGPGPLPPRLSDFLQRQAGLTETEQAPLLQGEPVTLVLEAAAPQEVAVFGAVWVRAPIARYVAAVQDIEQMERGGSFRITKRISSPPRLEDFDQLTLTEQDVLDLKACKVGSCDIKLGEEALARIQKEINWAAPSATADVQRLFRRLAFEYVNGYLEGGNARLPVYRDAQQPTSVAREFASMIDGMPSLNEFLPGVRPYLLEFPKVTLPKSTSFLYWQDAQFGLKPTIRISHVTIAQQETHVAVVSKMIYATHYFWTAIELRVLVPDLPRGEGFWFASVNRSRSDGLTGLTGTLLRVAVQREVEKGMEGSLRAMKARLEAP